MFHTSQKLTAEFLGTFALVFFGEGTACAIQYLHGAQDVNLLAVALAHGLTIAVFFTALGQISGGHFNPAVTMGFWATKRMNTVEAAMYWAAQIVERLKRPQEGLNSPLDCYVTRLRLISTPNRRICSSGRR